VLILGPVIIVVCALIIVFRTPVSEFMREQQRNMFGKAGQRVAQAPAALAYAIVGSVGIAIGIIFIISGVVRVLR
jgi:hypothetical protein